MTRFILVRHGQTEWNRDPRFRGRADLPLNETGLRQAQAAALSLKRAPVWALYSSPLQRTIQTADIIANELGLAVQSLDGLIDIDYGGWQGLSVEEAEKRDGELYRMWVETPHLVRFPEGESLDIVRQRALAAVDEVCGAHPGQTVILVSHMVVCKVLICAMLGLENSSFWRIGQDECALNAFQVSEGPNVVALTNDTCHLKDLQAG